MTKKIPAINQEHLSSEDKETLKNLSVEQIVALKLSGVGGEKTLDQSAKFVKTDYEEIVPGSSNTNNAYIVIGRDRPRGPASGYAGLADTQCGSIDIVVGRNSQREVNFQTQFVNPDFKIDAARIYISQKTKIDKYFGLKPRAVSDGHSGIGIKADQVRIMARHDIKLVTGMDGQDSRTGDIHTVGGIHLIAGNTIGTSHSALEPLVKGNQLAKMVEELLYLIDCANTIFQTWTTHQTKINKVVANHTHPSPLFAKPTFQSLENIVIIPQKMLEQAKDTAFDIEAFYNEVNNFRTFWLAQDRPFLSKKNKTN